jgi:hypothetical protein
MFQTPQMRQEMKLAPRMLQALRFLQVPWPELRELVRAELESNPVLEEKLGEGEAALAGAEPLAATASDEVDQENDFEPDDFGREIDALEQMLEPRPLADAPGTPAPSPEAEEKRQFFLDSITAPPSTNPAWTRCRNRPAPTPSATWTTTAGWRRTWRRSRASPGRRKRRCGRRWRWCRSSIRRAWRRAI